MLRQRWLLACVCEAVAFYSSSNGVDHLQSFAECSQFHGSRSEGPVIEVGHWWAVHDMLTLFLP